MHHFVDFTGKDSPATCASMGCGPSRLRQEPAWSTREAWLGAGRERDENVVRRAGDPLGKQPQEGLVGHDEIAIGREAAPISKVPITVIVRPH